VRQSKTLCEHWKILWDVARTNGMSFRQVIKCQPHNTDPVVSTHELLVIILAHGAFMTAAAVSDISGDGAEIEFAWEGS
jgi:hypothetical protein